jgi:hypothetical protein
MDRRLLVCVLVAALLVSCGGDGGDGDGAESTPTDPSTITEMTGVIVKIDSERLGDVESFDIKVGDTITTLYIDPEIEYPFPLGHLHEHLETAQPVRCKTEFRDGKLYAQTIDDA